MAKILSVVLLLQVLVLDSVWSFPSFDLRARSFTVLESRIASAPAIKRDSLPGGAQTFTGSRLTPDAAHPYIAPGPNDIRGPCPGLNTLANHGYLPRSGIVTPNDLINGTQEGFNMGYDLAVFLAYFSLLTDGDPLSGKLSIGKSTSQTNDPLLGLLGAQAGGLASHNNFEGDASFSRDDYYYQGDNYDFNSTVYQKFIAYTEKYGGGFYNFTVGAELRYARFLESVAKNPQFTFLPPRFPFAYGEAAFIYQFFRDGRKADLDLPTATSFLRNATFPPNWYRRSSPYSLLEVFADVGAIYAAHPVSPGVNNGAGNYISFTDPFAILKGSPKDLACAFYNSIVSDLLPSIFKNPTTELLSVVDGLTGLLGAPFQTSLACKQVAFNGTSQPH